MVTFFFWFNFCHNSLTVWRESHLKNNTWLNGTHIWRTLYSYLLRLVSVCVSGPCTCNVFANHTRLWSCNCVEYVSGLTLQPLFPFQVCWSGANSIYMQEHVWCIAYQKRSIPYCLITTSKDVCSNCTYFAFSIWFLQIVPKCHKYSKLVQSYQIIQMCPCYQSTIIKSVTTLVCCIATVCRTD